MGRITKLVDDYLSAGDKEYIAVHEDEAFITDPKDDEIARLRGLIDEMTTQAIARNSEWASENADLRRTNSDLLALTAELSQMIENQHDDLEQINELARTRIGEFNNRVFFLHQLLTSIAGYDGEEATVPRELAKVGLIDALDNVQWPKNKG